VDRTDALERALNDDKFVFEKHGPGKMTSSGMDLMGVDGLSYGMDSRGGGMFAILGHEDLSQPVNMKALFPDEFAEHSGDLDFSWHDDSLSGLGLALFKGETAHDLFSDTLVDILDEGPAVSRSRKRPFSEIGDNQLPAIDVSNREDRARSGLPMADARIGGPFDTEACSTGISVW